MIGHQAREGAFAREVADVVGDRGAVVYRVLGDFGFQGVLFIEDEVELDGVEDPIGRDVVASRLEQ